MIAVEHLRHVTRVALAAVGDRGFALAGSGALREHGFVRRPTEDVDLFTTRTDAPTFAAARDTVVDALRADGLSVDVLRTAEEFARLGVVSPAGWSLVVDLAVDWRAQDPVASDVGPLLSAEDAVANKLSALYSRAEARDFLDVDAIRRSGRFTDAELLALAAERDRGFDAPMFAQQLDRAQRVAPAQVAPYGVDAATLADAQARFAAWVDALRQGSPPGRPVEGAHRQGSADEVADGHVLFRDTKPYDVPENLDDLRGPDGGVIVLPFGVDPAPGGRSVDLDEDGLTGMAYEAILQEGTTEEIVTLVNRARLRRVWTELVLPTRARDLWEGRFPELASS